MAQEKGGGEHENGSRRQQEYARKHAEVHWEGGKRSSCFKIAHRRLMNLRMLTRCSDPLVASRRGSLGTGGGGGSTEEATLSPLPEVGVLFVCLFILAVPPDSLGLEVRSVQQSAHLAFSCAAGRPSAKMAGGSAREGGKTDVSKQWKVLMFHQHVRLADQLGDGCLGRGTTAVPVPPRGMRVRDVQALPPGLVEPMRLTCLACRRGSYRPTSNQVARGREPSTFPKHDLPASLSLLPEPHLKSTPPLLLTHSPVHSTGSASHFSLIYGAWSPSPTCSPKVICDQISAQRMRASWPAVDLALPVVEGSSARPLPTRPCCSAVPVGGRKPAELQQSCFEHVNVPFLYPYSSSLVVCPDFIPAKLWTGQILCIRPLVCASLCRRTRLLGRSHVYAAPVSVLRSIIRKDNRVGAWLRTLVSNVSHAARLVHSGPQPLPHAQAVYLSVWHSEWLARRRRATPCHVRLLTAHVSLLSLSVQPRSVVGPHREIIPSPLISPSPDLVRCARTPSTARKTTSSSPKGPRSQPDCAVAQIGEWQARRGPADKASAGVKRCYPPASSLPIPCICWCGSPADLRTYP